MERISVSAVRRIFEAEALARLFSDLGHRGVRYAVLRNYESLPKSIGARDIDILVLPENLGAACEAVCAVATGMDLRFANYYSDERLTQFALVLRADSGELLDFKIDFFTNSQIYGIEAFSATQMFEGIRYHNGIPVVHERFVFLDKWLFHVLLGQPLHPKYDQEFAEICLREAVSLGMLLVPLMGETLAHDLITGVASGLASEMRPLPISQRRQLLAKMLIRNGSRGVGQTVRFFWHRLRNFIEPKGVFLSLSGPDGSGKTTVIDDVITQLETAYGRESVVYQHFRPAALPRIADVAKAARAIEAVDADYSNPHRAKPSGFVGSLARLTYYYFDYLIGYYCAVRPTLLKRQIALFDRYYHDLICDPGRSRIQLPFCVLNLVVPLLPLPRYTFFIHVDGDEIYRRKQELSLERIKELNGRYLRLVRSGALRRVSNERAPEHAAAEIVDMIIKDRDAKARHLLNAVLK